MQLPERRIMKQLCLALIALALLLPVHSSLAQGKNQLTDQMIEKYKEKFAAEGDHSALINAVTNNKIKDLSLNRKLMVGRDPYFDFTLESTDITDQKSSGRCWLFAGMNIFAPGVKNKYGIKDFQLSEPYLTFYDKLEKANLFLEEMIELRDRPVDDRTVLKLLASPFGDGGWWRYVTDLLEKYGAVPINVMPETDQSVATTRMNQLVDSKLRAFAAEIRKLNDAGKSVEQMRKRKDEMMYDIYRLLVFCYGEPPTEFEFRYKEGDSTLTPAKKYTPQSFYEEFLGDYQKVEYVALMNDPTKEYGQTYQYEFSRNMADKDDVTFLNLSLEDLKNYALTMLLDSQMVYFACDVGKDNMNDSGIFAVDIYDYDKTFGTTFKMSRHDRVLYRDTSPNHAMVLIGVDTLNAKPIKWLVKNSWGKKYGKEGEWTMYDNWFDNYVYDVIVDSRYLSNEHKKMAAKKPIKVPVWDPYWSAMR